MAKKKSATKKKTSKKSPAKKSGRTRAAAKKKKGSGRGPFWRVFVAVVLWIVALLIGFGMFNYAGETGNAIYDAIRGQLGLVRRGPGSLVRTGCRMAPGHPPQ